MYAQPANQRVATFLGNPPMDILPVIYDGAAFQLMGQMPVIPCPGGLRSHLASGQRLNLGIRPEHIQIAGDRPCYLAVEIAVIEPLGRETLLRTRLVMPDQAIQINVEVAAEMRLKVGDRLPLHFNFDRLVAFDPTTQNNFRHG